MSRNDHYNSSLQSRANKLRKSMTKPEACLWKYVLSGRQMLGYQFRRQRPVLNYIADFMCKDLKLIIEVDGLSHESEEGRLKDKKRDNALAEIGFTTLRFSSREVLNTIDMVSSTILAWINENAVCPPPGPRQRGTSLK